MFLKKRVTRTVAIATLVVGSLTSTTLSPAEATYTKPNRLSRPACIRGYGCGGRIVRRIVIIRKGNKCAKRWVNWGTWFCKPGMPPAPPAAPMPELEPEIEVTETAPDPEPESEIEVTETAPDPEYPTPDPESKDDKGKY